MAIDSDHSGLGFDQREKAIRIRCAGIALVSLSVLGVNSFHFLDCDRSGWHIAGVPLARVLGHSGMAVHSYNLFNLAVGLFLRLGPEFGVCDQGFQSKGERLTG